MSTIKHLATVLASSSLSETEIREALDQLSRTGSDQCLYLVREIRAKADVPAVHNRGSVSRSGYSGHSGDYTINASKQGLRRTADFSKHGLQRPNEFEDVAIQVDRLLRLEAKLTADQAEKRLLAALPSSLIGMELPSRSRSKMSFREWVRRFAQNIPPRELLRLATLIRNEAVHADGSDVSVPKSPYYRS